MLRSEAVSMTGDQIIKMALEITGQIRHLTALVYERHQYSGQVSTAEMEAFQQLIEQERGIEGLMAFIEERMLRGRATRPSGN